MNYWPISTWLTLLTQNIFYLFIARPKIKPCLSINFSLYTNVNQMTCIKMLSWGQYSSFSYFRLCQTCNHDARMLFRVEAAVRTGLTNPTCTSQKATWHIPSSKTVVSVTPITSLDIQVHKYGKECKYFKVINFLQYCVIS